MTPKTQSILAGNATYSTRSSGYHRFLLSALLFVLCLGISNQAQAQLPDLTNGGVPTDDIYWNLGPTGMRGWFYHEGTSTDLARQIQVTTVAAGSPADGVLSVGDVIVGANGTGATPVDFTSDARKALAYAIADAEANTPPTLRLLRSTGGAAETSTVKAVADVAGSLDGKYFIVYDVNGSVGVWIDVDNNGTSKPAGAAAAARAIEVKNVVTGASANAVATAIQNAIDTDSAFSATVSTDTVIIVAGKAPLTDIVDGNTGFTFAVTQQGALGTTGTVSLTLQTLGAYSATAPYSCPKSAAILEKGLDAVMAGGADDNYNLNLLALIAGFDAGNPDNADRMERAQSLAHELILTPEKIAQYTSGEVLTDSKVAWTVGFKLVALAEYYLHSMKIGSPDAAVYGSLQAYAIAYANGQSMFGTGGHQFSKTSNGPYGIGYGVVNSANMQCFYGLLLAREAGINDQEVLAAIERSCRFYGAYVDRGSIPYGEHGPGGGYESNGKMGIAALAFRLEGTRVNETKYYAKMATASAIGRDGGHTGPYLNYLWAPLGANVGGPEAMASFFAEQSWTYDLARNWDGSFTFDTYGQGSGNNGSPNWGGNLQMYMACLLTYATPLRETYSTGRNLDTAPGYPILNTADVADAELAVDLGWNYDGDADPWATRATNDLLTDLGSDLPPYRDAAAKEIGDRIAEHATLLPTLEGMAQGTGGETMYERMGACRALGYIGDDSSLPLLVGLLTNPSIPERVRWAAARELYPRFSVEARLAQVDLLMQAAADTDYPLLPLDDKDPLHLTNGEVIEALFHPGGEGSRGCLHPQFSPTLDGINRDLLYPAIRSMTNNPRGAIRSMVSSIYGSLNRDDVEHLADTVVDSTVFESPADRMFSGGVRIEGAEVMQAHNFAEGVPISMLLAEELGSKDYLDVLIAYGADSHLVEPDPEVLEWLDVLEAGDADQTFTAVSNWPDPGTTNYIQLVRDAILNDPGPFETPEPFKRIHYIYKDDESLTLPAYWTGLHVEAHDFAQGDTVYTWRKLHGAGEVTFSPNGTGAAKDTTVVFDGTPGQYLFEVKMSDSRGFTEVTETVAITLYDVGGPPLGTNNPPTANGQSVTVIQGTPTQIILTGSDPEGYALNYTVTAGPTKGIITGAAPNLVYTAPANYTGSDSITFEVMDSEGQTAINTVSITVNALGTPVGLAIYEPFEGYPPGTSINGLSGTGQIGLTGTWAAGGNIYTQDPGYVYGPLTTKGSKLWHRGYNSPGQSRPINPNALTNSGLLADGTTLWFSVLIGADDTWTRKIQFALANASFPYRDYILNDGAVPGTGLGFEFSDKEFYAAQFFDVSQPTPLLGTWNPDAAGSFVRYGDLRLVVGKITWGAASDTVEIYLPLLPEAGAGIVLPDQPSSTLVANVDQSNFDVLTLSRGGDLWVDEIRFGATLQTVLMGTTAQTLPVDSTAPTPDPMGFAVAPTVSGSDSITMTATTAYDPLGVEYYFTCTAGGGHNSDWQESPVYTDIGLTPGVAYSYTVKARDKAPGLKQTTASSAASATIPALGTVPDVTGIKQSVAEGLLTDAGMAVGTVSSAVTYSLTVPAGHVLSQTPAGATSTAYGTPVNLVISIGQDPTLPTLASVSIVDNAGVYPVMHPRMITYTLTFSEDMDLTTIDASDFVNLGDFPIIIGAIAEPSPGVITVEVTPDTIEDGYMLFAVAQGAVIKDAAGQDLNTTSPIIDEPGFPMFRPDNYIPVVNAGPDQTVSTKTPRQWTPLSMTTSAWYDASDPETITLVSGKVSQWSDKSGNENHMYQATSTLRPTYNAVDSRLNNKPTIGYDLARKYLKTTDSFAVKRAYVVTYYDATTFGSWYNLLQDNANTFRIMGGQSGQNYLTDVGAASAYKNGDSTLNYQAGTPAVLPMSASLWTVSANTPVTNTWFLLSGSADYSGWLNGAVGEVVLTDGTEDLATQQKIEGYLAHKWGTNASLPVDHPYLAAAPTQDIWQAELDGTATDADGDPLTATWSVISGPSTVEFADSGAVDTTATFFVTGNYVLELFADDGTDQATDQVTITIVNPADPTPPTLTSIVDNVVAPPVLEGQSVTYTLTFSEGMYEPYLDLSDFSNAGTASVTINSVVLSPENIATVVVTPTSIGTLQLRVNQGARLIDLGGNPLDTLSAILDDTVLNVNYAPDLLVNPITKPDATEGVPYVGSIAGIATDPNSDTITYALVSSPTWLSVAPNGNLSGTPTAVDEGLNSFTVSAYDGFNPPVQATLQIRVWLAVTYTVSYNGNVHNDGTVPDPQSKRHNENVTLAINSGGLVKTGFTFEGWNTANDGTGTDYAAGATYTLNANVTLYANWNSAPTADAGPTQTVYLTEPAPWTPAETNTVSAWYDATDADSITVISGKLSQWNDKSGHGRHLTQSNATLRPPFNASDALMNGMPTIGKSATSVNLGSTATINVKKAYMVTYYNNPAFPGWDVLLASKTDATPDSSGTRTGGKNGQNYLASPGVDTVHKNGSSVTNYADANTILPLPASILVTTLEATITDTWKLLANRNDSWGHWARYGAIGEVILTDGTEDIATQQKIEGYLAHKWGTAAVLDGLHPYKDTRPPTDGAGIVALASLAGIVNDADNDSLTMLWTKEAGPVSPVSFQPAVTANSLATFTEVGTYTLRLKVNDGLHEVYHEVTIVVSDQANNNYASWATAKGITGEPFGGDFDNDGLTNGVEYALGLNPATSSQPAGVLSGNTITFTKGTEAMANNDVIWIIETSETLAQGSWLPAVTHDTDNTETSISYLFTPGSAVKKFARLKVVKSP